MKIEIPNEIIRRADASAGELRVALAIQLYADNRLDYADAVKLAGIPKSIFNRELLSRGISIQEYPARSAIKRRNVG